MKWSSKHYTSATTASKVDKDKEHYLTKKEITDKWGEAEGAVYMAKCRSLHAKHPKERIIVVDSISGFEKFLDRDLSRSWLAAEEKKWSEQFNPGPSKSKSNKSVSIARDGNSDRGDSLAPSAPSTPAPSTPALAPSQPSTTSFTKKSPSEGTGGTSGTEDTPIPRKKIKIDKTVIEWVNNADARALRKLQELIQKTLTTVDAPGPVV